MQKLSKLLKLLQQNGSPAAPIPISTDAEYRKTAIGFRNEPMKRLKMQQKT